MYATSRSDWRSNLNTDESAVKELCSRVVAEIERAIVGKRDLLEKVMSAILSDGHVLFEDYPGLAKTLLVKSAAGALGLEFKRIQFTPDLLPGDITGGYVYNKENGDFELRKGPIFANIILADEINRASPKTQSALLEAMQEHQVTIEGNTLPLPRPFIVFATQNPIEYEGTFPLPEAQLDRFIMKLSVGYPTLEQEQEILRRRRERRHDEVDINRVTDADELLRLQQVTEAVYMDADIERYIVQLVQKTREDHRISVGASPRGSLALLKLVRAHSSQKGRAFAIPDDVKAFAAPALVHRLILEPDLWMRKRAAEEVIQSIVHTIPVPVLDSTA